MDAYSDVGVDEQSPLLSSTNRCCQRPVSNRKKLTITVFVLVSLLFVIIAGCALSTIHYSESAACISIIPPGPIDAYTRSGAYSILYNTTSAQLTCFEMSLFNDAASVQINRSLCKTTKTVPIKDSYSWNNTGISQLQPTPVFSEDYSPQNYFINGSIQVDMVDITVNSSSVEAEVYVCLYTDIDDFCTFTGANWLNFIENAECHSVQVKTGDNDSITFNINKPTFAFVGIASTGSLSIGSLKIATNGVGLSGPGENSTKKCQLNGEHHTCKFSLVNNEREDVCLIAYVEDSPDGSFHYSNITIRLSPQINIPFWVCISILLLYLSCTICFLVLALIWVIYKRWKRKQTVQTTDEDNLNTPIATSEEGQPHIRTCPSVNGVYLYDNQSVPEHIIFLPPVVAGAGYETTPESNQQSTATQCENTSDQKSERLSEESRMPIQCESQRQSTPTRNSEQDSTRSENHSSQIFGSPRQVSEQNANNLTQVVVGNLRQCMDEQESNSVTT